MLLTPKEIQEKLKLSRDMTYRLFHVKGFPRIRLGNRYYVEEEQLQSFLKQYAGKDVVLQ